MAKSCTTRRIDREAGAQVYYSHDAADRLTGEHWADNGNQTFYAFSWDYDAVGNRTCPSTDYPTGHADRAPSVPVY